MVKFPPIPFACTRDDEGPGRRGGFADVGTKLLAIVDDPIDEQDDVVDAAQSMILEGPETLH